MVFRDKGQTKAEVADALGITPQTITNTCQNYNDFSLERALKDDPHPRQPIKFDDRKKAEIVAMVYSNPPDEFDRWTLELIRDQSLKKGIVDSISKETIRIIIKEHDLKPWQQKM